MQRLYVIFVGILQCNTISDHISGKILSMSTEGPKITRTMTVSASIDQVWEFLLSDAKMKQWFNADDFVIDVYEGGKIEIPLTITDKKVLIEGTIGLILPKEKFVFTWIERDRFGDTWFNNTTVNIELEAKADQTRLTLTHDGFKYLPENLQDEIVEKYQAFWENSGILERMQTLLEKE